MRLIGWILLILATLVLAVAQWPSECGEPSAVSQWRRTTRGWERLNIKATGIANGSVRAPTLHPMVVGSLEILLTLGALIAFSTHSPQAKGSQARDAFESGYSRSEPAQSPS